MITRAATTLAFLHFLMIVGCAGHHSDDALLREALQEKEAAYMRVAKAITHYCSISSDTVGSKQACMLERRLSVLQVEQSQPPGSSDSSISR